MSSKIGDIIQSGESIPDDVTEVSDDHNTNWTRYDDARWEHLVYEGTPHAGRHLATDVALLIGYGPLTVTAVREPEPDESSVSGLCEVGADRVTCIVADPDHRRIYHGGSTLGDVAVTLFAAEPEPQQADTSTLLDLVRQVRGMLQTDAVYTVEADELLDRIAALVPQQPVQARDEFGTQLFIHSCGTVMPWGVSGVATGEHFVYPPCKKPGPWRPLLVGGDPAPIACDVPKCCYDIAAHNRHSPDCPPSLGEQPHDPDHCHIRGRPHLGPCDDLIAQVMAELGVDRPEDVLAAVKYALHDNILTDLARALRERDEARDELERLHRSLKTQASNFATANKRTEVEDLQVIAERDDYYEWADRLANAIAEYLRIDIGEHSNMNLPWQAALIALTDAVSPQPSDPLVLSLPGSPRIFEVPIASEDITRVSDSQDEVWTLDTGDGLWHCDEQGWSPLPWHLLLADHGRLVEMAPPREPRTWPKLNGAPEGLKAFRGSTGKLYMRLTSGSEADRRPLYHPADAGFASHHRASARPLSHWAEVDGPLTEVFDDEPGGAR